MTLATTIAIVAIPLVMTLQVQQAYAFNMTVKIGVPDFQYRSGAVTTVKLGPMQTTITGLGVTVLNDDSVINLTRSGITLTGTLLTQTLSGLKHSQITMDLPASGYSRHSNADSNSFTGTTEYGGKDGWIDIDDNTVLGVTGSLVFTKSPDSFGDIVLHIKIPTMTNIGLGYG